MATWHSDRAGEVAARHGRSVHRADGSRKHAGNTRREFFARPANSAAIVWSFALTYAIMKVLQHTVGVRVDVTGLDLALPSESASRGGRSH
jgi:ammonia channel protein AmtB